MDRDFWFARYNGKLYLGIARHDEPVMKQPQVVKSVAYAMARARAVGVNVVQTGICPPDMIGLGFEV